MELIVESGHHGVLRRTDVQKAPAFATVVLEVDSVVSTIDDSMPWALEDNERMRLHE